MTGLAFEFALVLAGLAGGWLLALPAILHLRRQIPKRGNGGRFVSKADKAKRDAMSERLREFQRRTA